jgi:hypothetical protein
MNISTYSRHCVARNIQQEVATAPRTGSIDRFYSKLPSIAKPVAACQCNILHPVRPTPLHPNHKNKITLKTYGFELGLKQLLRGCL